MSRQRWIVGADIGGTNLVVGVVPAEGGEAVAVRTQPTDAPRGPEAVVTDVVRMSRDAVRETLARTGGDPADVIGMGVGCPGPEALI